MPDIRVASLCSEPDCGRRHHARGLCQLHHRRAIKAGTIALLGTRTITERFMAKVEKTEGCWVWTASTSSEGYGQFGVDGRPRWAHRVAYELFVGPIPKGLQVDHLCKNRGCVNPGHLEAVTGRENNLRSGSPTALNAAKTHCAHGHPFDAVNTYAQANGRRVCRACKAKREQARRPRTRRRAVKR